MRPTRVAYLVVTLLAAVACLPSLAMWSVLTCVAVAGVETPAGLALAAAVVTPGWLGWIALARATWCAFRSPDTRWPPWVRTSIAFGGIVAFWVALAPLTATPWRAGSGSRALEWFAIAGGPPLALAAWLVLPGLGDRFRHLRAWLDSRSIRLTRTPP